MPLLSVYNHLLQGYAMMHPTRFDSHKKSELKAVYQNILRLTAEQPLFKVTFDESAQTYTLGIKNQALSLSSRIKELNIDDGTSVFESKTLTSDQPEVVSIAMLPGADIPDSSLPIQIEVDSLSSPQENSGHILPSDDTPLPSGQYTFTIGVEENLYSFQFNVSAASTNLELQKKLSDFINKTSIGLHTQVEALPDFNVSRLRLVADAPGTRESGTPSLTAKDVRFPAEATHGIVTHFGLDQIAEMPQNTCFSFNGRAFEIRGRSFTTEHGLSLNIHGTTTQPVIISKATDEGPIVAKIHDLAESYNAFLSATRENRSSNHKTDKLIYDLSSTLRKYSADLKECGLQVQKDGSLLVDDSQVAAAAGDGTLKTLFSDGHPFSSSFLKTLSGISLDPLEYLNKTVVTYPNLNAKKTFSPYISSVYSGLLFNNYC